MKMIRTAAAWLLILALACSAALAESTAWTCGVCGHPNTTTFCTRCGNRQPGEIVCPGCGAVCADPEALFCGDCGTALVPGTPAIRFEGDGFDTPEAAVAFYLDGLKALDIDQMLRAFAWETQAEHFSVEKSIARTRMYSQNTVPRMPSLNGFMTRVNMHALRSAQISLIYNSLEAFLLGEHATDGKIVRLADEAEAEAFFAHFDGQKLALLSGMTNVRFLSPDTVTGGRYSRTASMPSSAATMAMYGADEVTEVAALADLGGQTLFCAPRVARYGEKWYLVSVNGLTDSILSIDLFRQAFVVVDDAELPSF